MKFTFDPKTGQYVPENFIKKDNVSELDRLVFEWLDKNPNLPETYSYSTRSLAYEFFRAYPEVDGSEFEKVRDAIAKWNNAHTPLMKPAKSFEAAMANPDYSETYKGVEIRVNSQSGMPDGYVAFLGGSEIARAGSTYILKTMIDEYLQKKEEKKNELSSWQYRRQLDESNKRDVSIAQRNGLTLDRYSPVHEYKDRNGFLHYTRNKLAVSEDAGGAAPAAAPAASPSGTTSGPATIDALSISCPVLPQDKKKKKTSKEGLTGYNATGDCFRTAWNTFYNMIGDNPLLVHGVVTGRGPLQGVKFVHAWVEVDDMVYDKTMPMFAEGFPKQGYYGLANIEDDSLIFRYDSAKVADKASQYKTYGPWEDVLWEYTPE